jgi:tetratricopeptide (TPR) repeat protein
MHRDGERWTDLRALHERRAKVTLDDAIRKNVLLELAQLEDTVLADPARAIEVHRRVLEVDPAELGSYKRLERLYADTGRHRELEELLGRELDHVADKDQIDLQYRRAELRARHLDNPDAAVDLLEDVVGRRPGHADARELLEELASSAAKDATGAKKPLRLRVARILEPLYEKDQLWKDLVVVLRAQHELAGTPVESVDLLARIAAVEEEKLGNPRAAFETWAAALVADPADDRARAALQRLAQILDRWNDATGAWEKALTAAPGSDVALPPALLGELATM